MRMQFVPFFAILSMGLTVPTIAANHEDRNARQDRIEVVGHFSLKEGTAVTKDKILLDAGATMLCLVEGSPCIPARVSHK